MAGLLIFEDAYAHTWHNLLSSKKKFPIETTGQGKKVLRWIKSGTAAAKNEHSQ